jgi:hypothetical protein
MNSLDDLCGQACLRKEIERLTPLSMISRALSEYSSNGEWADLGHFEDWRVLPSTSRKRRPRTSGKSKEVFEGLPVLQR